MAVGDSAGRAKSFADYAARALAEADRTGKMSEDLYRLLVMSELAGIAEALGVEIVWTEALQTIARRIPITAEMFDRITSKYQQMVFGTKRLRGLKAALQFEILDKAKAALENAIRTGLQFKTFRDAMAAAPIPTDGLGLIFHMQTQNAMQAGAWTVHYEMLGKQDDYDLVYSTVRDARVDAGAKHAPCKDADGLIAPKSSKIWRTLWPPLHFGCRCPAPRIAFKSDYERKDRPKAETFDRNLVPEEFRNWPGDGFTLALPTRAQVKSTVKYLEGIAS